MVEVMGIKNEGGNIVSTCVDDLNGTHMCILIFTS